MRDGRSVANYILDYCDERGISLTNLKLQKIIYFCHAWFLVHREQPLIRHNFEAWEFGPVIPYLYRALSGYRENTITGRIRQLDHNTGALCVSKAVFKKEEEDLLRQVISFYSHFSARELVELSHVEGGPWWRTWHHESIVNPGMKISNDAILEFYLTQKPANRVQ